MSVNLDLVPRILRNFWVATGALGMVAALCWMSLHGQIWNLLLLAGVAPTGLATLARLSYNVGWVVNVETAQTAGVFSAMLGSLWIFLVLAWRNREALLSHERIATLAAYDPVTGLMLPHIIDIRLPQMLLRAERLKPGCGVLMLRWLEHAQTQGVLNNDKRAASLARIGAILRGASRDIDTVARHGADEFMMLVEGPVTRNALSDAATQILAASIRSSQPSNNAFPVNVHIAIWHGGSGVQVAQAVIDLLKTRLQQMSSGTKRPVQFVDGANEAFVFSGENGDWRKQDLITRINALETSQPEPSNVRVDRQTSAQKRGASP